MPRVDNFKKFFNFLMLSVADKVSFYNNEEALLERAKFKMRFENFSAVIVFDKGEIVIINEKHKIKFHFVVGEQDIIKFDYKDYFY